METGDPIFTAKSITLPPPIQTGALCSSVVSYINHIVRQLFEYARTTDLMLVPVEQRYIICSVIQLWRIIIIKNVLIQDK